MNQAAKLAISLSRWPNGMQNERTVGHELNHTKVLGRGEILKGQKRDIAGAGGRAV